MELLMGLICVGLVLAVLLLPLFKANSAANDLDDLKQKVQRLEDRLNHASLLDGARISGARFQRYAHRDIADLRRRLTKHTADGRCLIISDGTFSMDGTVCDVAALVETARTANAWLMLDEAHSLGVAGQEGRGLVDHKVHSSVCA